MSHRSSYQTADPTNTTIQHENEERRRMLQGIWQKIEFEEQRKTLRRRYQFLLKHKHILTDYQFQIMLELCIYGKSVTEIAEIHNVSHQAISKLIKKIVAKIKKEDSTAN
jgi:DNA-binding CsgD family transcriptional regulator